MILGLFLVSSVLLVIYYFLSPVRWVVQCARVGAENSFGFISQRRTKPTLFFDENKKLISERNKFFGLANGNSMQEYGIRHGDEFIGDYAPKDANLEQMKDFAPIDSLVVVGEPGENRIKHRMRRVEKYAEDDGKVYFYPDKEGKTHKVRPISSIIANVAYVTKH